MKKLKKSFSNQKKTVEAMRNSCAGSCSCNVISCPCAGDGSNTYSTWQSFQNQHRDGFKNAAW